MGIQNKLCSLCHIYLPIILLSLGIHVALASDTIFTGQSLTGNQTLTSQGGTFELGFFKPGNSAYYYLGIWYKQVPVPTVVWVANREEPLLNTSSELQLSEDGNLVLLNQFKIPIWSTNSSSSTPNSIVAVLLDTGNLALRDGSNSSEIIWQSFEHPTDTWLPHGSLGMNKVTGKVQVLSSWINQENPSPGLFTEVINKDGAGEFYLVWNRTQIYWRSGIWNGQIFPNVAEMTPSYFFKFSYVSNEKENYFTYTVDDSSVLTRYVVEYGQGKQFMWVNDTQKWLLLFSRPNDPCDANSICGSFGTCNKKILPICECLYGFEPSSPKDWNLSDWSGGCVRKTSLQCGHEDGFLKMPDMYMPTQNLTVGSAKECESACIRNCSCSAYSYGGGCSIWSGGLQNLKQLSLGDNNGTVIYIRLATSDLPTFKGKNKKVLTIVIVVASVCSLALLGIILLLIWSKRLVGPSSAVQGSLVPYKYKDLQIVTNNFSAKLGAGCFGSVFKGELSDSSPIAVKMLEGFRQGEKEFRAEVSTLGTVQHVNLVRLRGFCSEGTKRLLVYDHMPFGSLDIHLFGKNSKTLEWKMRYQIALGTARGLAYLHEECRNCIIHCDIKPENILLDVGFCPKVADFGLAKLFGHDFSRVLTTVRGTRGYLAPEWISGVAITSKADVYSYGMMLFEIMSGRRNLDLAKDGKFDFFPTTVASRLNNHEEVISLLDSKLEGNFDEDQVTRACNIACWCIQEGEMNRPSMGYVVQVLEGVIEVGIPPVPLYLQNLVDNLGRERDDMECSGESSLVTE